MLKGTHTALDDAKIMLFDVISGEDRPGLQEKHVDTRTAAAFSLNSCALFMEAGGLGRNFKNNFFHFPYYLLPRGLILLFV